MELSTSNEDSMDARIINIVDTRDKMTVLDSRGEERVVGIPGTGDARACSICGKIHEIHVIMDTGNGVKIMGLGCARKSGFGPDLLFREARNLLQALAKDCPEITVRRMGRSTVVRGTDPGFVDSVLTILCVGNGGYPVNWESMTKTQKLTWNKVENRMWKMRKESQEAVLKAVPA